MNKKEIEALISELTEKKAELEKSHAVLTADLERQEAKLEEASARVLEIVGSTDEESVKAYLENLEKEIQLDVAKLKEME